MPTGVVQSVDALCLIQNKVFPPVFRWCCLEILRRICFQLYKILFPLFLCYSIPSHTSSTTWLKHQLQSCLCTLGESIKQYITKNYYVMCNWLTFISGKILILEFVASFLPWRRTSFRPLLSLDWFGFIGSLSDIYCTSWYLWMSTAILSMLSGWKSEICRTGIVDGSSERQKFLSMSYHAF